MGYVILHVTRPWVKAQDAMNFFNKTDVHFLVLDHTMYRKENGRK